MCLSCFACVERCPRDVEPAKLIEAVRLAVIRAAERRQPYDRRTIFPQQLDDKLPQQAIVSAMRKYSKVRGEAHMQRIGVFVCWCGSNIAATVDVKAGRRGGEGASRALCSATDYQYMCSENGQALIRNAITEHGADRRGHLLVLAENARSDVPQNSRRLPALTRTWSKLRTSANSAPGFTRTCPKAPKRRSSLRSAAIAKVNLNAPLTAGDESGYEARAGYRRRHRGHSDRAGRCGRGLRGRYR